MITEEYNFVFIMDEYIKSGEELADAAALCGDDPIKKDMVAFITPQFDAMCARSEGVRAMLENSFAESREFILIEMVEITKINLDMAEQIRNKIGEL